MSDKTPADYNPESRQFSGSIIRRISAFFGRWINQKQSMEELQKESPELAKYISKIENGAL